VEDLTRCAVNDFTELETLMIMGNKERTVHVSLLRTYSPTIADLYISCPGGCHQHELGVVAFARSVHYPIHSDPTRRGHQHVH